MLERWVKRHLGVIDHERRVAEIASKLFDLTWPLHGLCGDDRRLLCLGAIVHDVGRAIDDDLHPQEGARMILEDDELPLDDPQRRALAYLTRYHRGKVPPHGCDDILRRHDDADSLRTMLALLRAADALDSRSIESPQLMFELVGRRLNIACILTEDTAKARRVYTRRKKFKLLEELLDCRVETRIIVAGEMKMVA